MTPKTTEKPPVLECTQTGPLVPSDYTFVGHRHYGLYEFDDNGKRELFARRKSRYAGWQLVRGNYYFEFVRSVS